MSDSRTTNVAAADGPQRVGPLTRLPRLLGEFAVPMTLVLEGTGIAPSAFEHPETRIPYTAVIMILGRCAKLTLCPHLGPHSPDDATI